MTWETALALVHRFYGFSVSEVDSMTLKEFTGKLMEIGNITKLEMGDDGKQETPLAGDAGFKLAQTMFPRGRSRRR